MRWLVVLGLGSMLAAGGCVPAFQNRLPNVEIEMVPSRVAALPAIVNAYELDANGGRVPKPEWTAMMAASIGSELQRLAKMFGQRAVSLDSVKEQRLLLFDFMRWGGVAAMEIAAQQTGRANYGLDSVGNWRYGRDLSPLRAALGSDFAQIVVVRDIWQTGGRIVLGVLSGTHTYWKQVGVACVADLRSGRMVWCNVRVDAWGDLRTEDVATAAVQELVGEFYGRPQAVVRDDPEDR